MAAVGHNLAPPQVPDQPPIAGSIRGYWEDPAIPVNACRDRMSFLERDITRLALTVEHLCTAVASDRDAANARRKEMLEYIKASGERSEKVQQQLSDQISVILKGDVDTKLQLATRQAQWGLARWLLTAAIALAGVVIAYKTGWDNHAAPPAPPTSLQQPGLRFGGQTPGP